ncbi:rubrerythrin [Candidatus Clostridium radicumherbarum]|uniref:Rubrerythrin n=1 Tax=Candidatus Clostridium radicumherbarum TaxID=3381662 RepID=A0ABW8TPU9_9CLOT
MRSLQGTKTAENLSKAFAGESQARNRYTIYAKVAEDEGHQYIAEIFRETADEERAHAKIFFDFLTQGLGKTDIKVDADYPIGLGNTEQNLQYAAEGEKAEWGTLYPQFSTIAKEEGFADIEFALNKIVAIETWHEKRYLDLMNALKNGALYKKNNNQYWKCMNCGFIFEGLEAPKVCPACKYPQGWFQIAYDYIP